MAHVAVAAAVYLVTVGLNAVDPSAYDGEWRGVLDHAENDTRRFRAACERINQGSTVTIIGSLVGRGATRGSVRDVLGRLAASTKAGDLAIVYFSGHGAPVAGSRIESQDWTDESLCLFDGLLLDKELGEVWSAFDSVDVCVVTDTCHGGGVLTIAARFRAVWTRAGKLVQRASQRAALRKKAVDHAVIEETRKRHPEYDATRLRISRAHPMWPPQYSATIVQIAACGEREIAYEDGAGGIFTRKLLTAVDELGPRATYGDLDKYFRAHRIQGQTPSIGPIGRLPGVPIDGRSLLRAVKP